ncbi:MAG TPA: anti-anti-sigma factor [Gammaproteobacteria bacterium]|nr:anti-anti-sigma factor [Gammaproteobacteria bacterium]HBK11744.1 anti-anti-sigma factor [Gammaproteobacteria bacterium]|tara:strand:- start:509 stop:991 length:483 start_codon:yes stop_codon:yes gene_type:complete
MSGHILVGACEGNYVLKFSGDIRVGLCGSLDAFCERMLDAADFRSVIVDLAETLAIDSTALGCLARLSLAVQRIQAKIPTLICRSSDIERVLLNMGFDDVFAIVAEANVQDVELVDIPAVVEQEARQRVIEAHKVLMSLNDSNRAAFKSLVDALEQDKEQ